MSQLLSDALHLSDRERADFAARLIDSLDTGFDEDVDAAWDAEIARRLERLDSGKARTIPWPELRQRLMKRINDASAA